MAQSGDLPMGNRRPSESNEQAAPDESLGLLTVYDDFFVPLLPKLAATRVSVSKQYILQISVAALRVTSSQSVHYDEDDDSFFATLEIHVPEHENIPQFRTTIFAGHNYQTMDAALESASIAALLYMQKANILIIDDLNFPELQRCQKEVMRTRSWSDIFEHETVKLKKIGSLETELASLKESNVIHIPIQHTQATGEPAQQVSAAMQASTPPTEQEFTELVPVAKKYKQKQNSPAEPNVQAIAVHQVSTPPYEHQCAGLFGAAKKSKEDSKGKSSFLPATTSADTLPSRTLPRTDSLGAKRTLFPLKKKGMDA